jgi:hypothetical protein
MKVGMVALHVFAHDVLRTALARGMNGVTASHALARTTVLLRMLIAPAKKQRRCR